LEIFGKHEVDMLLRHLGEDPGFAAGGRHRVTAIRLTGVLPARFRSAR